MTKYSKVKRVVVDNNEKKKKYHSPLGTVVEKRYDRTVYRYPSGKKYVEHKSLSKVYGKAYDWRCDG